MAFLESINEVAFVRCAALPFVSTEAARLAKLIIASVRVSIVENVCSPAMLQTIDELSLIPITILPLMHTVTIDFTTVPLTDVRIPSDAVPHSTALLGPLYPLTVILFTARPSENAFTMRTIIEEVAQIGGCIGEEFVAAATAYVILPISFIHARMCTQ